MGLSKVFGIQYATIKKVLVLFAGGWVNISLSIKLGSKYLSQSQVEETESDHKCGRS